VVQWVSFLLGYVALGIALVLAALFPDPTRFQVAVFAICCGVSVGGIANGFAGTLGLQLGWLTAGGSIAVALVATYVVIKVALPDFSFGAEPVARP
jgi:hypothetical protein